VICCQALGQGTVVRVGYFPNVTHSQAAIGRATGRFEQTLGHGAPIEWKTFNAGPSVIEAIFAGALDLAYVGSGPTITGYVRSQGEALRVIAGATSGGAALVVRSDSGISTLADFHGKKVASPQLGNTQDVALRAWLHRNHLETREKGGDVQVIPIANPDQFTLFVKREIDGAWAPEPWATRLIRQANGRLFLDERDLWPNRQFVSTHLVVTKKFLEQHRDIVKQWLRVHVELTNWINANLPEARRILNQQIRKDTSAEIPPQILEESFSRLQVTYDPLRSSLLAAAQLSQE